MLNDQRKKKNGIPWCDFTWNPISGCLHNCPYCYMNAMKRFNPDIMVPGFKPEYLKDFERTRKVKPGDRIFVGSSGDMWGRWNVRSEIESVLYVVGHNMLNTFQFLTKNPTGYFQHFLPHNGRYGTTVDGLDFTKNNIDILKKNVSPLLTRFVSFEPLLKPVNPNLSGINWIIIGADSTRGAAKAEDWWADNLIAQARALNIPVFVKANYNYHTLIEEFPR